MDGTEVNIADRFNGNAYTVRVGDWCYGGERLEVEVQSSVTDAAFLTPAQARQLVSSLSAALAIHDKQREFKMDATQIQASTDSEIDRALRAHFLPEIEALRRPAAQLCFVDEVIGQAVKTLRTHSAGHQSGATVHIPYLFAPA